VLHEEGALLEDMVLALWPGGLTASPGQPEDLLLFDFAEAGDLNAWTNLELP
jgi:hypothetical protein